MRQIFTIMFMALFTVNMYAQETKILNIHQGNQIIYELPIRDIDSITFTTKTITPAVITGTVYFEAGYSLDEFDSYVNQPLPAAGAEVLLNVAGKEYWVTTDVEGYYSLEVPMDINRPVEMFSIAAIKDYRAIYTNEYLEKDSFIFVQPALSAYSYLQINIGDTVHVDKLVSQAAGTETKLILKRDGQIVPIEPEPQRNTKVVIQGVIKREAEKRDIDSALESIYKDGFYYKRGAINANDTVYVTITGYAGDEYKEFIYQTVAVNGIYSVTANIYDIWLETSNSATYQVILKEDKLTPFKHYYYEIPYEMWKVETVEGTWSKISTMNYISKAAEDGTIDINEIVRSFTPTYEARQKVHGIGNPSVDRPKGTLLYQSENPFGWRWY